ncbi:hypothetical protein KI387_011637 [Taxus chinensis]|uniref:Acid phosphatase n=1 Tax=Taxus chinensis TaxID=29808 RepID=A0AA38FBJ5_TAXCH|nr:hypothetical protein KI387_011637 [Taxus chinensis]
MGKIGGKLQIDFVISTGDNFYQNGLNGTDDPSFQQSFSQIYTAKSLQKQWYAETALVDFFFIDTSPFIDKYWEPSNVTNDWRGILPRRNSLQFLTSGGGSKAWDGMNETPNMEGSQFFYPGQGFMSAQATNKSLHIEFYDIEGKTLHEFSLSK